MCQSMPISIPSAAFGFCSVCSWRRCWFAYIARRSCTFRAFRGEKRVQRSVKQTFLHALLLTIVCSLAVVVVFFFVSQSFGRITIFFIFLVVLFSMGPPVGVGIHKYSSHCFALLFLWLLFLRLSSPLPSPLLYAASCSHRSVQFMLIIFMARSLGGQSRIRTGSI